MISKRDSKPFKIKFAVGVEKTNKVDMQYENDWHTCYGLIRSIVSGPSVNYYGYDAMYDKIITLNAGGVTRKINYNTLFIVDNIPTSVYENGDYSVRQIHPEYNGEIVIGLVKNTSIDIPKLYFEQNGMILYCQLNFDKHSLKAYVSKNENVPFSVGDYVWTREPVDANEKKNRLKLESITKTGLDSQFKSFYELKFVKE